MRIESSGSVKAFYPPSREELLGRLRAGLPALQATLPIRRVVLTGSWAQGRATAFSDIDLVVIYVGAAREDAYRAVRRAFGLRGLEPHVYTEHEAAQLDATLNRMTAGGIVLYG